MATVQEAVNLWRQRRRNVSDYREINVGAWIVELEEILVEMGLSDLDLMEYLDDDLHTWVECEYEAYQEAPAGA